MSVTNIGGGAVVYGSSFIKTGGTSSQFLKADGSVDSSSYVTTSTAASTYAAKNAINTFGVQQIFAPSSSSTIVPVTISSAATGSANKQEWQAWSADGTTGTVQAKIDFSGNLTANSFVKTGGTSSQFLKADGSVDSSTYLTTGTAASTYAPLTSPSLTTPSLGVATATSINGTSIPSSKTLLATDSSVPTAATTTSASAFGFVGMPQVSTATGLALTATHAGKHIYTTVTGQTHTLPANGTTALEVGTTIVFINPAAVTTTIAITTDTLILAGTGTTGTRTLAPYGMATAVKITSTSWMISGNGLT
ncbi:hypothetical protein UFOVP45_27 [uncultured Caudovirales phage]|uniref:Uncharacterized protein n=1 Tax=uncultured Caudovirales phage TaxID=2100421 RepID=A0A6J5KUF9_9CAUD|nr:hypothetical protein UFOVP45_27 [uncultured Caudovirales phage]